MASNRSNSGQTEQQTADVSDQDFQDFANVSGKFVRTARERRPQRRRTEARPNTTAATTTREGVLESTKVGADHETVYDAVKARTDLAKKIENIIKYIDKDVQVEEEIFLKCSPKAAGGRVASVVASLRSKCGSTPSPQAAKTPAKLLHGTSIQELRKKYESSMEAATTPSPKAKESTTSPKLKPENKVGQLAFLLNNKTNSVVRDSPLPAHTTEARTSKFATPPAATFTSTPNSKSPKIEPKLPTYRTKLPSPKSSPLFNREHLSKTLSCISSPADSSIIVNKPLEKQNGDTACLVAENVFSQLSVKNKVLLYNNFIEDMTKQNPKFSKHAGVLEYIGNAKQTKTPNGEVVFEKQDSVKHLLANLEAKISPNKPLESASQSFLNKSTAKSSLDSSCKSKEFANISQISRLDDTQDVSAGSNFTVVLKSSPEATKASKRKDVTFAENVIILENPRKRHQSLIRSPYGVELLAPPKKIRRFRQEHLAPEKLFRNPRLEKLFYAWLENKNGVAFDITAADNKNKVIELVAKNLTAQALPAEAVQQDTLKAAVNNLEASKVEDKNNGIVIINHTLENENRLEKSFVEVELPLEDEQQDDKSLPAEASDAGLTGANKTTRAATSTVKPVCKKKLRRHVTLNNEIPAAQKPKTPCTDSGSECKAHKKVVQSFTLPRTTNCAEKMISNSFQSSTAGKSNTDHLKPSKNKPAFTLTVQSLSPFRFKNDFYTTASDKNHIEDVSRSCPSLLETAFDSHIGILMNKSVSEQLTDFIQPKLPEQQNRLMENFTGKSFSMYANEIDSPVRINIKTKYNTNKSDHKTQNVSICYKVNTQQQAFTAQSGLDTFIPMRAITATCKQQNSANLSSQSNGVEPERNNTASSLNESSFYSRASVQNRSTCNLNVAQKANTSQFWISSGDFTAAVAIHYYESQRLKLLYNIYAQKSLTGNAMNFGIDGQKFAAGCNSISNDIIKKLPQRNGCSQYWFSTGNVLIPFRGPKMSTEKVRKFFNYIREFMEQTDTLRFGIDGYEFSNVYQQTVDCATPTNCSAWCPIVPSPLKTSDLDHSDLDSGECEQSLSCSSAGSLQEILAKYAAIENNPTVADRVKTLEDQQAQFKVLKESHRNCKNSAAAHGPPESFRNVMPAGNNFCRGMAKTTAV